MSDFEVEDFADDDIFTQNPGEVNATLTYVTTDEAETELGQELTAQAWELGRTVDGRPIRDDIARAIDTWSSNMTTQMGGGRGGGDSMFFRNRYAMSTNPYDQMLQVADACEHDEIVSAILDSTEGMAFQRLSLQCVDVDQQDVWSQICENVDLSTKIREIWRELFKASQCYVGVWWEQKTFTVRTNKVMSPDSLDDADVPASENMDGAAAAPKKRKRRKQFEGLVPTTLTIFDPTKVMPVGNLMFNKQRFAYLADKVESDMFHKIFDGQVSDPMVLKMLAGPYQPNPKEKELLSKDRNAAEYMWLFRPEALIRLCLTKSAYERFSPIRLKSVLPLLDMKTHLRASDRAHLIGSTNFIIVLTRGSDKLPAKPGEIEQLREQARVVARMPILIGDHRLNVEIITPKMDFTLNRDRYDTIDERIIMRALGTFRTGGNPAGRSETAGEIGAIVMRNIESRRNKIAEDLERDLFRLILQQNESGDKFLSEIPNICYHPRRVSLSTDQTLVTGILALRDRGEISRETTLEEFDYNQDVEYVRRKREKPMDNTFMSSVPFSSPSSNPLSGNGGRPPGAKTGGSTPAAPKSNVPKAASGPPTPGGGG